MNVAKVVLAVVMSVPVSCFAHEGPVRTVLKGVKNTVVKVVKIVTPR